jgi:4-amino-4-deoxy-L-arabinose transferase-like glycosyltransferase
MSSSSAAAAHAAASEGADGRRFDLALLAILALALVFRSAYLDMPLAEAHRWRTITNADIARNFYEASMNIFQPQVSWGGNGPAYVGMEFPLLQWLAALLFFVTSNLTLVCRGLTILFSIAAVWATYGVGARLFGRPAGRAAAFLLAVSPSFVFFGRTFISDVPMVFFSVAAVWAFVTYADTGQRRAAWLGAVAAAFACLVKIPAVVIFLPIAWCAWRAKRWRAAVDPVWVASVLVPLAVTALWYWYADVLFHRTGLGQAIWHASGGYAASVAVALGDSQGISHWSRPSDLVDVEFYRTMLWRFWSLHLTPVGFALTLFALVAIWTTARRIVVDLWLAAGVLLVLASIEGNRHHEFHQLPLLPPLALLFGLAAAPVFDGDRLRWFARTSLAPTLAAAALVAVAVLGFQSSGVVRDFYRPDTLDRETIDAGRAIAARVPEGQTVITVEWERYGGNSPILLFWAHRKGWSFDLDAVTPHVVQRLSRQEGAAYFATTIWPALERQDPVLADYLRSQERIPIDVGDTALFRLR